MWNSEQWGTNYQFTHVGPFRVWISQTSPHPKSAFVGRFGTHGSKSIRVTMSEYANATEAKYATLIALRNKLQHTLNEINEMLEGTEEP